MGYATALIGLLLVLAGLAFCIVKSAAKDIEDDY